MLSASKKRCLAFFRRKACTRNSIALIPSYPSLGHDGKSKRFGNYLVAERSDLYVWPQDVQPVSRSDGEMLQASFNVATYSNAFIAIAPIEPSPVRCMCPPATRLVTVLKTSALHVVQGVSAEVDPDVRVCRLAHQILREFDLR